MKTLKSILYLSFTLLLLEACSSRGSNTTQFADANQTDDGNTTSIPTYSSPLPTASPLATPTPTATPIVNTWQNNSPTAQSYSGVPQTNNWTAFTGWPYSTGYDQNYLYNNQYNGYQTQYQTQYNPSFPNYHANYSKGYYIAAVTALYRGILGRDPDLTGLQFWMRELIAGRPYTNMREEFLKSPEITALGDATKVQNIIGLFRVIYGVMPQRAAIQYWVGQLSASMPLSQVASSLRANPQYGVYGYNSGFFTRSVVDIYKGILGRFANYDELSRDVNAVGTGAPIVGIFDTQRASAEATSIGKLTAENCIAAHRIIRGTLPDRTELARCVAMGDNTAASAGTPYNPVLQRYIQQLMYGSCSQYTPCYY